MTGVVTLAFLPFAAVLADLPKAVLSAVIVSAVVNLVKIGSAVALHLYRETQLGVRRYRSDDALIVELSDVLYFGSVYQLEAQTSFLSTPLGVTEVVIDVQKLGRGGLK